MELVAPLNEMMSN